MVDEGGGEGGAYDSSPAFSRASRPSRNWSSEREMWPSWESRASLSVFARCRSRRESLMWSARRRRALGLDILAVGDIWTWDGEKGNGSKEMQRKWWTVCRRRRRRRRYRRERFGGGTGINQPGHAGPRMSESRDLAGNAWGALRTCPAGTVWWHVRITPDVVDSEALYRKAAFSSV